MIVDNFKKFPREFKNWEFYFVQVIERHKDNPDKKWLNWWNSCRVLKSYTISTHAELDKRIPILKEYCQKYKARCYIHPARRSNQSVAYDMIIMLWEHLKKHNHNLSRLFDSACWHNSWVERLWIIDIDTTNIEAVESIKHIIDERWEGIWKTIYSYVLPTVNWYHLITTPFDTRILSWVDIHKNNPTLLYCNFPVQNK